MATISELLVRIRPEGIDETNQQLERHSDTFDDTADGVESSTDDLEGFASRWKGAMTAIVAGLAIAAAGLATQIPVVGEVMSGLSAIIQAIAFQLDRRLRPALSRVTAGLFDLSAAIFEGDWEQAGQLISDGITAFTDVVEDINFFQLGQDIADMLVDAVSNVDWSEAASTILDFLFATLKLGTWTTQVILGIVSGLVDAAISADWSKVVDEAFAWVSDFVEDTDWGQLVGDMADKLVSAAQTLTDWANIALEIGNAILLGLITWLVETDWLGWATSFFNLVVSAVSNIDWSEIGIDIGSQIAVGLGNTLKDLATDPRIGGLGVAGALAERGAAFLDIGGGGGGGDQAFQRRQRREESEGGVQIPFALQVQMDGRNLTDQTGRYRVDELFRRARGP